MRWIPEVRERARALLFRSREEAELDEELAFHLEMETEKNLRAGMTPAQARRRALVAFGGVAQQKEAVREARGLGWVEVVARDVTHSLRGLRLNPLFTLPLVLTLALGIAATAVMFSIVDALVLRPLPYHEPDRLVEVQAVSPEGDPVPGVGWDAARTWGEQAAVFEGTMSHVRRSLVFTGGGEPRMLTVEGVTAGFEEILGVRPALGRGFLREDAEPGAPPVAVLDHAFWRRAFGADPAAIGRAIELDGRRHRIVGVMPEGFRLPQYAGTESSLWLPLHADGTFLGKPVRGALLLGRIGSEPVERVQARADALARVLAEELPREGGWAIRLLSLEEKRARTTGLREAVWFLSGAVGLLLLIAAVNATSLLLARGWSRGRELAVRIALGASRRRVAGQLLVESALLAALSGAAAFLLAGVALHAIRGIVPGSITFWAPHPIRLEGRALAFTFLVAAAVGALIGVHPALRAARLGSAAAAAGLTPYASRTPARSRLRRALVVVEVALSVTLLVWMGLLANSFARLVSVDPGFRIENLAVMRLSLSSESYPSGEARAAFLHRIEERIEAIPGVEGVAVNGDVPPWWGLHFEVALEAEGSAPPDAGQPELLPFAEVPPDFFEVLEVPVVAGRPFLPGDAGTDRVIVDRGLARFLWAEASPVERRFRVDPESGWLTVVGVVDDLRMSGPDDRQGRFEILYPLGPDETPSNVPLAIRTRGDPGPLLRSFRAAVHELDPSQPIEELRPARELYAETVDMPRFLLVLMSTLSGLALLLAAVGIHGMLAFAVEQRRRDLGIRIALGATLARVCWEVLGEGLRLAAVGVATGTGVALALSRLVRGQLYGVGPGDPATLAAVVTVGLGAAALACYWPARRAARVDPAVVLRSD